MIWDPERFLGLEGAISPSGPLLNTMGIDWEENFSSARRGIDDAEKMMVNRARIVIGKISLIEDMHPGK